MLRLVCLLSLALAATLPAQRPYQTDSTVAKTLIALEQRSWRAWQDRDSTFFRHFLSEDHVEVGTGGPTGKAAVVAGVGDRACVVREFRTERFHVTQFAANTALVVYRAAQLTLCHGKKIPSPVWVSSLYVFRDGRWQNAAYQQTLTPP